MRLGSRSASAKASAVLPAAVGPTSAIRGRDSCPLVIVPSCKTLRIETPTALRRAVAPAWADAEAQHARQRYAGPGAADDTERDEAAEEHALRQQQPDHGAAEARAHRHEHVGVALEDGADVA